MFLPAPALRLDPPRAARTGARSPSPGKALDGVGQLEPERAEEGLRQELCRPSASTNIVDLEARRVLAEVTVEEPVHQILREPAHLTDIVPFNFVPKPDGKFPRRDNQVVVVVPCPARRGRLLLLRLLPLHLNPLHPRAQYRQVALL